MPGKHPKIPKIVIMIYVSSIFLLQLKVGGFIDPSCVFFGKSTDLVNLV